MEICKKENVRDVEDCNRERNKIQHTQDWAVFQHYRKTKKQIGFGKQNGTIK